MTIALPLDRLAIKTAEILGLAGDLSVTTALLGGGGIYNPAGFLDVSAYSELHLRSLSDVASAAGGVQLEWSFDGTTVVQTDTLGAAAAATLFDSGALGRTFNWVRVKYTNGVGAQGTFRCTLSGYQVAAAYTIAAIGAAITAAVPPRTADAGNTRASAALPGGGAWDGAGRLTDDPGVFARADADITCPVDAAGMFYAIHGPTVAAVDGQDPTAAPAGGCAIDAWPAVVVWTEHRAPVALRDKAYRFAWRGTAGSVVAVTATLDPRPVDLDTRLRPTVHGHLFSATVDIPIPPGTRWCFIHTVRETPATGPGRLLFDFIGGATYGASIRITEGLIGVTPKFPVPTFLTDGATRPASLRITEATWATSEYYMDFYP